MQGTNVVILDGRVPGSALARIRIQFTMACSLARHCFELTSVCGNHAAARVYEGARIAPLAFAGPGPTVLIP